MKIYFAGSIRGGRKDAQLYNNIIAYLREKGQVLTEHVGSTKTSWTGETSRKDEEIYNRDMEWLQSANVVVAEVTIPSLGVGYELGIAEKLKKPTIIGANSDLIKDSLLVIVKKTYRYRCINY